MAIIGDLGECRKQIARYQEAGVKTLLLAPVTRVTEAKARKARILDDLARLVSISGR